MENGSPHDEKPRGGDGHQQNESSFLTTAAVWFGSSLLLYLLLQALTLVGLDRATVSNWNDESIHALASYQLFGWWECTPQHITSQCSSNPLTYLLSSGSLFEVAIKTLQLVSGVAFVMWILGVSLQGELLIALPLMFVSTLILFAIPFVIAAFMALLNLVLHTLGLNDQLRTLVLSLISLVALPIVLPIALITIIVLAATTLVSIPVLILSYLISGALETVLPEKPTLPLVLGGLTATTVHCLGKGGESTVHEYLKHALLRFVRSVRP